MATKPTKVFAEFAGGRRRGSNSSFGIMAEQGVAQKTHGARATNPGKDQGEANAPFVDNKLSLFFSAVNGGGPLVRKWWDFIDGFERIVRIITRG